MEVHLWVVPRIDEALMLMSPHHEIKKLGEKVFGKIPCFSIGVADMS